MVLTCTVLSNLYDFTIYTYCMFQKEPIREIANELHGVKYRFIIDNNSTLIYILLPGGLIIC